jgi:uncharacterized repeat protein (TIGR03803 family)
MALVGGANDQGTLFEYDISNNVFTKKIDFDGSITGSYPSANLVSSSDGKLYGTTSQGGIHNNGVLFEFDPSTGGFTVKFQFESSVTGNDQRGALALSSSGKIYGTNLSGGASNGGTLFEYDPSNETFTKRHDFSFSTGIEPRGGLIIVNSNSKIEQTITFNPLATKIFSNTPFNLTASSTSGLAITYTSSDTTIVSINGSTAKMLKAGTVTITASQAGNSSYNPAASVSQILTINKANQVITFDPLLAMKKGDAPFVLTASSTSGLTITYTSSNPRVASISGNVVTILKTGETVITASQPGNSSYKAAIKVLRTLLVNKKRNNDNCDNDSDDDRTTVYPNPASDFITVRLGDKSGRKQVSIFQLNGLLKAFCEVYDDEITFNISDYQNGIYVVRIVTRSKIELIRFEKR